MSFGSSPEYPTVVPVEQSETRTTQEGQPHDHDHDHDEQPETTDAYRDDVLNPETHLTMTTQQQQQQHIPVDQLGKHRESIEVESSELQKVRHPKDGGGGGGDDIFTTQPESSVTRVYKKCASNGSLAVYVGTRTLAVRGAGLEPLKGVIVLDKDSLSQAISNNFRIWGQITLTFRYGREDEEVLGLKFCNEAILSLKQLWPPLPKDLHDEESEEEELTPLQVVLLERVKSSSTSDSIYAVPFSLSAGAVGIGNFPPPPSVLLVPAKPYKGSPIGTIYDLRIYAAERPEERPPRRNLIRLALRIVQIPCYEFSFDLSRTIEARPTFLSRGKIRFHVELNKNAVRYGEPMEIYVNVQNNSRSSIRRVIVSLIQQVDVCMFTSGKFKNTVGMADDAIVIVPGASLQKRYVIPPLRGSARQWLALEEAFGREPVLAPSTSIESLFGTLHMNPATTSRNVFAIIVSYYVKAKLILGSLSNCPSVKISFGLLPPLNAEPDAYPEHELPPTESLGHTPATTLPPSSTTEQTKSTAVQHEEHGSGGGGGGEVTS